MVHDYQVSPQEPSADTLILFLDPAPPASDLCVELGALGCNFQWTHDFNEATELARNLRPAVVAIELRLGQQSGLDALKDIKKLSPTSTLVMTTMYGSIESAWRALQAGASNFLTKPFTACEILSCINADCPAQMMTLTQARREYIQQVSQTCPSLTSLARTLGIDRTSLRRMIRPKGHRVKA